MDGQMSKREYKRAVRDAQRVIGFIPLAPGRLVGVKISKRQALFLAKSWTEDKPICAEWGDPPDNTFLFVGSIRKGR